MTDITPTSNSSSMSSGAHPNGLVDSLPRPIGFALGGGGSLGAAQVGMLEALKDHGVQADLVAGTSIGSLNGAIVAADPIGAASRLSHIWHTLDAKALLPGGLAQHIWTLWRSKTSLYDTPDLSQIVHDEIGDIDIEQLAIPYAAMVLDVETSTSVRLSTGPLTSAVLASSALPGVFPAIERDGRRLYDRPTTPLEPSSARFGSTDQGSTGPRSRAKSARRHELTGECWLAPGAVGGSTSRSRTGAAALTIGHASADAWPQH
jgi:predicted acylesterase/phospholipase RssA